MRDSRRRRRRRSRMFLRPPSACAVELRDPDGRPAPAGSTAAAAASAGALRRRPAHVRGLLGAADDDNDCQRRLAPDGHDGLPSERGLLLLAAAAPLPAAPAPAAAAPPAPAAAGAAPDDSQRPSHLTPELPSAAGAAAAAASAGAGHSGRALVGRSGHRLHRQLGGPLDRHAVFAPDIQPGGAAISPEGRLPPLRHCVQSVWAAPGRPSAAAAAAAAATAASAASPAGRQQRPRRGRRGRRRFQRQQGRERRW